jgi:hypothetical protein
MSTNSVSPAQGGASDGADEVDGASQPCPLKECAALVYCLDGSYMAVKGIDAEIVGAGGPKPTDEQGTAEFLHLKPPNKDYTAKVTLKGDSLKKYVWRDTDAASTEFTQNIGPADEELYKFRLIALARPQVKVLWKDGDKPIGDVGVKLQAGSVDKYTLSNTGKDDGIAKLADQDPGVKPGGYTVAFPTGIEHCEVVEDPGISVEEATTATFLFHVEKFFVSFQLKDQFDEDILGLDWVLRYPDGKQKDSGKFGDSDKGTVKKDQVPKGDYIFAVQVVFAPEWAETDLEIGKDVVLRANAAGFDANTDVKFEIFDSHVLSGSALDTVTGKTGADPNDPTVEATWKPDAEKLKKVASGAVVFVASAGAIQATSGAAAISGKQTFDVKDSDGQPVETTVDFTFSGGGGVVKKSVQSTGGKAEPMVPLGATLLSLQLSAKTGSLAKFTGADSKAQEFVVPTNL